MAQLDAANARRQQAAAEWFPRLFLDASFGRQDVELNGIGLGAARYTNVAGAAGDADLQRRPHAGHQRHRRERPARSAAARRGRHRARAGGRGERARRARVRAAARAVAAGRRRPRPTRRWAARNRSTTAGRSTCCRCSTRSARAWRCASAPTTASTQLLLDSVQLYKALGGGWQVFEPAVQAAAQPPHVASASQP